MQNLLLPTTYWGPISYFMQIAHTEKILLEGYEHYPKQTIRNRCTIYGANGPHLLTIPVTKGKELKIYTKEIKIDHSVPWQKIHWRAILSAYNNSPFFQYYMDDILPFYQNHFNYLFDYNLACMNWMIETLNLQVVIEKTPFYMHKPTPDFADLRNAFHSNASEFLSFKSYRQVFEPLLGFFKNLSILDLLFNTGPEASLFLINQNDKK